MDTDTHGPPLGEGGDVTGPEGGTPPPRRRRRRLLVGAVAAGVAVVAVVVLLASQLNTDPKLVRSPLVGKAAPDFALPAVDGGTVRASDFAGRPYVVNFWATWCVACRREHPYLMAFYNRWSPQGVGMVGVVFNDDAARVRKYRAEMGTPYKDVTDPGGRTALDFGVYGVPETFVVDADGIVVTKFIGQARPGSLDGVLTRLARRR